MIFIISIFIIIGFHELAHLIVAKLCKCPVDVFSIGFGKPILYSKKIGNTIYQITPWILGGYCKLKDELKSSNNEEAFSNLTYMKKVIISLAGIGMNLFTGLICYYIGLRYNMYVLIYFGYMSMILGLTNAVPFPALDGSYPILFLLENFMEKEKALKIISVMCKVGFAIIMVLNIVFLPLLLLMVFKGQI